MRRLFDPINLAALGFALSLLAAWQLLADAHLISPIFFPSPLRALTVLQQRLADGSLWLPLAATSLRMIIGWLLASVIGIALGAAIGTSRLARELLDPTLDFIRPLRLSRSPSCFLGYRTKCRLPSSPSARSGPFCLRVFTVSRPSLRN
jgi:ABC-type nitrate/sulfonate/bicarbonate transport system permease component